MEKFDSKAVLARMMAEEDIFVEHDTNARTASFLLSQRTLVLPVWKDVSDSVYIQFVGHEVGHALITPADDWKAAIDSDFPESVGIGRMYWKDVLNVVEDIRIERFIKNRFNGIRRFFVIGYNELYQRKFFGNPDEIQGYDFLSRLNVHYKMGDNSTLTFSNKEKSFFKKIDQLTDFQSVVDLSKELVQFIIFDKNQKMYGDLDRLIEEEHQEQQQAGRGSGGFDITNDNSRVITVAEEEKSKGDYIDNAAPKTTSVFIPRLNTETCVIPWQKFHQMCLFDDNRPTDVRNKIMKNFRKTNYAYINNLVKEFHLHRSAKRFRRATVSKTGKLDISKIAHYKTKDDLFLRNTIIPDDKNHGMVMLLDMSGSMSRNIKDTLKQTILLAEFCRRIKIPFSVYAFTTPRTDYSVMYGINLGKNFNGCVRVEGPRNIIYRDNLLMVEILSSEMDDNTFNFVASECLARIRNYIAMASTPLNEAITALLELAVEFKKKHKKEKMMTVILTDGSGSRSDEYYDTNTIPKFLNNDVIIHHKLTHSTVKSSVYGMTNGILQMYKNIVGGKLVSYFVTSAHYHEDEAKNRMRLENAQSDNFKMDYDSQMKTKGYFAYNPPMGYDTSYVIPNVAMDMKDLDFDDEKEYTMEDIENEFISSMESQVKTRMFVNEFITHLA